MTYKARIKFGDAEWLVVDKIEYQGKKYYYIVKDISEELEKINSLDEYDGNISLEFIYQLDNGNYKNVIDQELISKLLAIVGKNVLLNPEEFE